VADTVARFQDCECIACGPEGCACGDDERALRRIAARQWPYGPMTQEQREWCAREADSAWEGSADYEDLILLPDRDLAADVLQAWNDYVRCNCL
jgi:hypothetical protein